MPVFIARPRRARRMIEAPRLVPALRHSWRAQPPDGAVFPWRYRPSDEPGLLRAFPACPPTPWRVVLLDKRDVEVHSGRRGHPCLIEDVRERTRSGLIAITHRRLDASRGTQPSL